MHKFPPAIVCLAFLFVGLVSGLAPQTRAQMAPDQPIKTAALIYGHGDRVKVTICFSEEFLAMARQKANIPTAGQLTQVRSESPDLGKYPFAVLVGEGLWTFTPEQRSNIRSYLENGGFILASAGCGSRHWASIFREEMGKIFPDAQLVRATREHPVYDIVYDLAGEDFYADPYALPELWTLEINGRTALVFSPGGLNDTDNASPSCCCCGGADERFAKFINVNILAYAMTH